MNRFTIIADDKSVSIDGVGRSPLEFEIDPSIHAVQWYGAFGEVEFKMEFDGTKIVKPSNQMIADYAAFQSALDAWASYVPPPMPTPPGVEITQED